MVFTRKKKEKKKFIIVAELHLLNLESKIFKTFHYVSFKRHSYTDLNIATSSILLLNNIYCI